MDTLKTQKYKFDKKLPKIWEKTSLCKLGDNTKLLGKLQFLPIGHFILIRIFAVIVEINAVYNSQIEQ